MCVPERYVALAWGMLASLRRLSDLPVEVHHAGDELSAAAMETLAEFDVTFVDTAAVLGWPAEDLRGYQLKPFALAASAFSEVFVVDADVLWFQPPRWSGPVFVHRDRNFEDFGLRLPSWSMLRLRRAFPGLELPPMHRRHHAEAGVVCWDKSAVGVRSLLFLNGPARSTLYRWFFGDKETYWIAAGLEGVEVTWAGSTPGAIVGRDPVGGAVRWPQMLHHHEGSPAWAQGGHLVRKRGRRWPVVLTDWTGPNIRWRSPTRFTAQTTPIALPWLEEIGREVHQVGSGTDD